MGAANGTVNGTANCSRSKERVEPMTKDGTGTLATSRGTRNKRHAAKRKQHKPSANGAVRNKNLVDEAMNNPTGRDEVESSHGTTMPDLPAGPTSSHRPSREKKHKENNVKDEPRQRREDLADTPQKKGTPEMRNDLKDEPQQQQQHKGESVVSPKKKETAKPRVARKEGQSLSEYLAYADSKLLPWEHSPAEVEEANWGDIVGILEEEEFGQEPPTCTTCPCKGRPGSSSYEVGIIGRGFVGLKLQYKHLVHSDPTLYSLLREAAEVYENQKSGPAYTALSVYKRDLRDRIKNSHDSFNMTWVIAKVAEMTWAERHPQFKKAYESLAEAMNTHEERKQIIYVAKRLIEERKTNGKFYGEREDLHWWLAKGLELFRFPKPTPILY